MLFVDFDGVFHAAREARFKEWGRPLPNPALFYWRPLLEEALAPHPAVRIVISPDWRLHFNDENVARLLGPSLGTRTVGVVENFGEPQRAAVAIQGLTSRICVFLMTLFQAVLTVVVSAATAGCRPSVALTILAIWWVIVNYPVLRPLFGSIL